MASPRHSRIVVRGPVSLVAGIAVAAVVIPVLGWIAGLLAGWAVITMTNVVWLLATLWPMDAAQTREHATSEDPGRTVTRTIALAGSLVSLGAVVTVLVRSHDDPTTAFATAGIAILAVVSSWSLIQVDYMVRYAHRYYGRLERGQSGGIDFNQDDDPMYSDFGYFSVGLGLTYQVSDNDISANEVRRLIVAQTLVAYLFGAVILASVINLVAGIG
jgi:uncharacterized membrane protein